MKEIYLGAIRSEFNTQIVSIRQLVHVGEQTVIGDDLGISRETRGLATVLLFASYERLLSALARELLETAATFRGKRKNFVPGIRAMSISDSLASLRDSERKKLWSKCGPQIISQLELPARGLNTGLFPDDGSFMDTSQVDLFCDLFGIADHRVSLGPARFLIKEVREGRNAVAHGRLTADEVGRRITYYDLAKKIDDWDRGWNLFLDHVEKMASTRSFFTLT